MSALVPEGRLPAEVLGLLAVLENDIEADIERLEATARNMPHFAADYLGFVASYRARLNRARAAKAAHDATYRQVAA